MANPSGTDARLRRSERFVRADYRRTFAEGKSFPSRSFVGWVLQIGGGRSPSAPQNLHPCAARLGVVVSKRVFPLSVERNRARRLMREAFRTSKGIVAPGAWVLLIGRRHLVDGGVKGRDVAREFRQFLRKAKIAVSHEGEPSAPRREDKP